jgi:hypothetical protein
MCDLYIAIEIIKRVALKIIDDQPLLAGRLKGIKGELEDIAKALEELEARKEEN